MRIRSGWRCFLAAWASLMLAFGAPALLRGFEFEALPRVMPASEPYSPADILMERAFHSADPIGVVDDSATRTDRSPILLASNPEATTEFELSTQEKIEENIWDRPIDARNGFFQEVYFDNTWLCGGTAPHHLGEFETELRGKFALPLPNRRHPLLLMPGFAAHFMEGPKAVDVPPRLYDAYLQLRWLHKLSTRWSADVSVTPGVYSDFEQSSSEALRISGHFGAMWDWTETAKIALGVVYLDRQDYRVLPFAGLIWEPTPDLLFELMVPRPQIAKRVYWYGAMTEEVQDWVYLAGELGGGSWAVRRSDMTDDVLTYSDLRLILGLKRQVLYGADYRVELAYVFARKLEYDSPTPEMKPSDTVMLRAGMTY